ncbi:3-oxoacyl-ACP reductase [Intrasporangium calvum]|uniref:Short-chain dehydrogenase/reductase SDR n=1 Tax=Intrasporangium calvum (strain ATCC 23552 / DSM 43043 / JCM 3097 / NBRC 12989 / NCIMB 10167 / NRRL B-3866 / 7 KIP) TaxID=710696 RepID=E6SBB2_INTC7|nr:3-oxoacyl-ACP reductase [Intrasporangium calvum]ADU48400.1 short-chain dehydrogenase/reductase SDR [Intrasporangium calvum DSM 43043]
MADLFTTIVTSPLARKVGVPQPTMLRRHTLGDPLVEGPVLVAGGGHFEKSLVARLEQTGLNVGTSLEELDGRLGALVLDLSAALDPAELTALHALGAPAVKQLATNSRVVVIGTDPATLTDVAQIAAQRALEGFTRSLGKELRLGATANHVLASAPAPADAEGGVWSAVEFFLSGRSAYVDGQVVRVGATPTPEADALRPLVGKVAVVTGAARGIGAEIARVLARDGATVVAVDVPQAGDSLAAVANEVRGTALQLDVTAEDAGRRILEHAVSRHGSLDIVVHNAGILRDKLFVNMSADKWAAVLDVNLRSIIRMNEAFLGDGGLGDGGRIVCLSSIAGIAGNRGQTNYAASKAGLIGVVQAGATQVADRGITVNAVAPGFIETEMTRSVPFATREVGRRSNSLQQGGLPRDVAETIAWLAQPGAAAVNGQVLRVCGQSLLGA